MTAETIIIGRDASTGDLTVRGATYDIRDELKALGGRWRAADKTWLIPPWRADDLIATLRAYGYRVTDTRRTLGDFRRPAGSSSWAEAMFASLPTRLHEPAYRALVRVLHPDIGGDARSAQQLNDARPEAARSAS